MSENPGPPATGGAPHDDDQRTSSADTGPGPHADDVNQAPAATPETADEDLDEG